MIPPFCILKTYIDNLSLYPFQQFNFEYNKVFTKPDQTKFDKLNRTFKVLRLIDKDFYPSFTDARSLFCEHLERLYLEDILEFDFGRVSVINDKFQYCSDPGKTLLLKNFLKST